MTTLCRRLMVAVLACGAMGLVAAPASAADDWSWSITPYLWAVSLEADVDIDEQQVLQTEASFNQLLDKLDFAGQVHFEGQRGEVGFFVDLEYYDFNDDEKHYSGGQLPATVTATGDLEQWIVELGGLWNPSGEVSGLALLGGGRILTIDNEIDFEVGAPINATGDTGFNETLYDVLLGARYQHQFDNNWSLGVRGDVSTGDTDLTWNAMGTVGYTFGDANRYTVFAGYRHMVVDFDDHDGRHNAVIEPRLTYSGPLVAFRFGF